MRGTWPQRARHERTFGRPRREGPRRHARRSRLGNPKKNQRRAPGGLLFLIREIKSLLNRTRDCREHIIRIRPDEPDCANDKDKNHRQHHRILGNVLSLFVVAQCEQEIDHRNASMTAIEYCLNKILTVQIVGMERNLAAPANVPYLPDLFQHSCHRNWMVRLASWSSINSW